MMAGKSLDDFFSKYVRGKAEIDYDGIVNGIGLDFNAKEPGTVRAYIGADMIETDGRLTIRSIPSTTPAFEQGLNTGDQIIAIDGYRATQAFLQSYIGEKKPSDTIKLSLFRFDKLRDITFTLGTDTRKSYDFSRVAEPTEDQKRLYLQYLSAEL
jgi:predicted metalloprotease with PDZ domain